MCDRDGGRMWGVGLCGPTLFVERGTRAVVGNEPLPAEVLPKNIGIANTAVDWNGKHWTMVVWPLPEDAYARRVILAHESFHRVQEGLGFPATGQPNAHLATLDGRTLLQLEWRALAAALEAGKEERRRAVADALYFRELRRKKFAEAAKEEGQLEMNEGLAEYSGTALAEPSVAARAPHVIKALHDAERYPTFERSFAYASGPAYGALLDAADPHWRRKLKRTDDLGVLLAQAYRVTPAATVEAGAYGGAALTAAEQKREEARQAQLRAFQARFIDGPTLVLPLINMNIQFDPNETQAFPGHGTVYPKLHINDDWGSVDVTRNGALLTSDWKKLIVPRAGDDYTLTLKEGWEVMEGTLRKK